MLIHCASCAPTLCFWRPTGPRQGKARHANVHLRLFQDFGPGQPIAMFSCFNAGHVEDDVQALLTAKLEAAGTPLAVDPSIQALVLM